MKIARDTRPRGRDKRGPLMRHRAPSCGAQPQSACNNCARGCRPVSWPWREERRLASGQVAPESGASISMERRPCAQPRVQRLSTDRAAHSATVRKTTAKILGQPSREVAAQRRLPCAASVQAPRAFMRAREGAAAHGGGRRPKEEISFDFNLKIEILDTIRHDVLIRSENLGSDITVGIRITPPSEAVEERKTIPGDDQYDKNNNIL
ncbi:ycf20-like protein [Dorcoceras hygrometricum]|uniref:Ycf20-like protein n=1 Tax=Dorcoceras hygrometricum TaxID=472368 RepID=A0A2Z7A3K0_9LAMI|nr:ycf20-like protein [Dorcoceras hygrometricum]